MSLITLDFENYFDKKYSLKNTKISTTEYIRDPRFKVHGVGIKIDDGPSEYWYGNDITQLYDLKLEQHEMLCHHTHYDGLILSDHFKIYPGYLRDTLSTASCLLQGYRGVSLEELLIWYAIGQKGDELAQFEGIRNLNDAQQTILGHYCCNDVDRTWELYQKIAPLLPQFEHDVINMIIECYTHPRLRVDHALAIEARDEDIEQTQALIAGTGYTAKQLGSSPQFAEILRSLGMEPPMKISAKTGKPAYAFAKNDLAFQELEANNPQHRTLFEARRAVKSTQTETRAERLMMHSRNGKCLPIYYKIWGGHTGRVSGADKLNSQNFLRGGKLRRAMVAPENHVLIVGDSSQIEVRMNADFCDHHELLEAFRQKRDIYSECASKLYNRKVDRKKNPDDFLAGFVGKVTELGSGYGMGWLKYQRTLAAGAMGGPPVILTDAEAQHNNSTWRTINKPIVDMWYFLQDMLHIMADPSARPVTHKYVTFTFEKVILPNGHYLYFPELAADHNWEYSYATKNGRTKIYGGKLLENIIQALARLVVFEQTLELRKAMPIVLSTHDEAVGMVHRRWAEHALDWMLMIMRRAPWWSPNLPLDAEGGWDICYSK